MKVIIIGKGAGWQRAPDEGETWGVNNLCLRRDVELSFNMHDLDKHRDHPLFKKTIEHVNRYSIPIVTQKKYPHIPTSIPFPLKEMPRKYFGNSIDYMIAYAIHQRATHIDMYGVVMEVGTEYTLQRPSLEYWIGYAEGCRTIVTIHEPTCVLYNSNGLYGYDWDEEHCEHVLSRSENQVSIEETS